MENKNASENAFACVGYGQEGNSFYSSGLTKREHFAGLAMQSLITAYPPKLIISDDKWTNLDIIATVSIKIADELLTQLSTTK